jgi:hypothetical protein
VSPWYSRNFGDPLLAGDSLDRLAERFRTEYERAGRPPDMAVFVRPESEGRLHCELQAYFSPAAARVAQALDAAPCNPPAPAGLALVAGAPEAWQALFPDRET